MFTDQMKQELIDKIKSIEDENVLEEVYRILKVGTGEQEMIILSSDQKDAINKGIKDIEDGNYLSDTEANREIEEWLKK